MLVGLSIRDVVLIASLDLSVGAGLTVLTGETGAGKSIILDALGLATGQRAEAGLVRPGAERALASALFAVRPDHPVWALLEDKGLAEGRDQEIALRRQLGADGRSRAFVNDQPVGVTLLREIGQSLVEVHGQHETVGLLDPRTHRGQLDAWAGLSPLVEATRQAFRRRAAARAEARDLAERLAAAAAEGDLLRERLSAVEALNPRPGEETALAGERALLGAAEKALADIGAAREALGGDDLTHRLAQAFRALERARDRAAQAGAAPGTAVMARLGAALEAIDRTLNEAQEALAGVDAAAEALEVEPGRLEAAEERLFALRALARQCGVGVDALAAEGARLKDLLEGIEAGDAAQAAADRAAREADAAYEAAASTLTAARRAAAARLTEAVEAELAPLKLDKARFRVAVDPLDPERAGPEGTDRVVFEIATNPGAPFGALDAIASGGELARFALALKASLAAQGSPATLIFDEVDQGVGGAVADAVGLRLRRLAQSSQVVVVTHSPQVAARGARHWKVRKEATPEGGARTTVEALNEAERAEEIARMLSGAEVTDAARAAARALIEA